MSRSPRTYSQMHVSRLLGPHASGRGRQDHGLADELAGARLAAELSPPRLDALSTAVVRHFKRYDPRGLRAASVRFYDGYVVTVLEHGLTQAEPRWRFPVRAAEQALGRRVLAHRTQVVPESGIRFEIFELARPPEGSERAQLLGECS